MWWVVSLLFALSVALTGASAQSIIFTRVPKDVVEQRVRELKKDNAEREATLKRSFADAGCDQGSLKELPVKHEKVPNVLCILKGTSDSVIVVGAHTDHVARGEGAVDNWSGAALLPSLLQSISNVPRKHTFVFVGFTAEEQGLVGSKAYADGLSKEDRANIRAMVDIDTLGLSSTKVWATRADKKLLAELVRVAQTMKLPLQAVNADKVGAADSFSFDKYKIPTIAIHSITQETWRILHTDKDTLAVLHMDEYYDTYRLLAVYLAYLDNVLP
ncbi:MAG: Zn-dependent exopeptidase M28 [Acidobacteriia bacterium]|nr:Zn-dependent exopeptidase M28 [Terriglobia bacterium]